MMVVLSDFTFLSKLLQNKQRSSSFGVVGRQFKILDA
jgi:hypothetical protein